MRQQERDILADMRKPPTVQIGAPIDWRKYKAMRSLERAIDTLRYKGHAWDVGEAALATSEAVALLRSRVNLILDEFR